MELKAESDSGPWATRRGKVELVTVVGRVRRVRGWSGDGRESKREKDRESKREAK